MGLAGGEEAPFPVGHRADDGLFDALCPNAGALFRPEGDPTAFEAAVAVVAEGKAPFVPVGGKESPAREQAGLHQGLETVAYADDGLALIDEAADFVLEKRGDVQGEEAAGAEGVGVGEAAGNREDSAPAQDARIGRN